MNLRFLVFASIVGLLAAVTLIADTVIQEVVARVNDEIITRSEFQRSHTQVQNEFKDKYVAQAEQMLATKEKDVLRDLIDQALLWQKGNDLGTTADTYLIKRLHQIR